MERVGIYEAKARLSDLGIEEIGAAIAGMAQALRGHPPEDLK